jgi:hypothetical protein
MSAGLAFACGWSLARSAIVALVAVPVCVWLRRRLAMLTGPARRAAWGVLVLPFLFPTLLSGYAYSTVSLQLASATWWEPLAGGEATAAHRWLATHNSAMDEILLELLLLARLVPVGTMLLAFASASCLFAGGMALPPVAVRPAAECFFRTHATCAPTFATARFVRCWRRPG